MDVISIAVREMGLRSRGVGIAGGRHLRTTTRVDSGDLERFEPNVMAMARIEDGEGADSAGCRDYGFALANRIETAEAVRHRIWIYLRYGSRKAGEP